MPPATEHGQRPQTRVAKLGVLRDRECGNVGVSPLHRGETFGAASRLHVTEPGARLTRFQHQPGEVARRAQVRGANDLIGSLRRRHHQDRQVTVRRITSHRHDLVDVPGPRDRLERLGPVRRLARMLRGQDPLVQQQQRVAVRTGVLDPTAADRSARPGDVPDHDRMRQQLAVVDRLPDHPTEHVASAPRRERDDDLNRPPRILRSRRLFENARRENRRNA